MRICDTNLLTSFNNYPRLSKFGDSAISKFGKEIKGNRYPKGEEKSKNLNSCWVNKELLINDISKKHSAMGAILTYTGLKNVEVRDIKGNTFSEGKKIYNKLCERNDMTSEFREKFCDGNRVKRIIKKSPKNDIRLVGSAVIENEKEIITNNLKDIKPIEEVTDIKVR